MQRPPFHETSTIPLPSPVTSLCAFICPPLSRAQHQAWCRKTPNTCPEGRTEDWQHTRVFSQSSEAGGRLSMGEKARSCPGSECVIWRWNAACALTPARSPLLAGPGFPKTLLVLVLKARIPGALPSQANQDGWFRYFRPACLL